MHDMRLTSTDAASFFIIGLVRRPCDYMMSVWASSSANQWEKNAGGARKQGWWGRRVAEAEPRAHPAGKMRLLRPIVRGGPGPWAGAALILAEFGRRVA